jgi:excisionase family DNA binding protein
VTDFPDRGVRTSEPADRVQDLRPFYTTQSLARRLSLSERTVRDLIRRGEIPSYKVAGARRFDPADIDSWLAQRRSGSGRAA